MNLNKKLASLESKEPSSWLEKANWRKQNRSWLKKSAVIALKILQELRKQNLTQKELAEKLGISAQQVNKIVKGQENLTLETLDKLEKALDIELLYQAKSVATVLINFGNIPVAQKSLVGITSQRFIGSNFFDYTIDEFDSTMNFLGSSHKLHKRYPIEGKEKWCLLHTERS